VQELLSSEDLTDLDLTVSHLQEALYGLNRRLAKERIQDSNPLQGLKNTLGSLKDELFADDDWDDWDRGRSRDPWAEPSWGSAPRSGLGGYDNGRYGNGSFGNGYSDRGYSDRAYTDGSYEDRRYDDRGYTDSSYDDAPRDRDDRPPLVSQRRSPRQDPFDGDPWAED
jgi:molecular chaperone DnaK